MPPAGETALACPSLRTRGEHCPGERELRSVVAFAERSDGRLQGRGALPRLAGGGYSANGVGLAGGGSIPKVTAVRQVIEKLPVVATSATRLSSPIVFSAAA